MTRFTPLLAALSLAACSAEDSTAPAPATGASLAPGTYAGSGRDALCVAGEAGAQRAGFIVYGAGKANCSATGRITPAGAGWTLSPTGDSECRIALSRDGDTLALGAATPACAYYCGPDVAFQGKAFQRAPGGKVTDLAGDQLC